MPPTGQENVDAAWGLVDTATTNLAAFVTALLAEIANTATEGLNGPQTAHVESKLTALAAALTAMGQDPGNPIPPAPVVASKMPGPFRV